jgi:hypothetical protein
MNKAKAIKELDKASDIINNVKKEYFRVNGLPTSNLVDIETALNTTANKLEKK